MGNADRIKPILPIESDQIKITYLKSTVQIRFQIWSLAPGIKESN